MKLTAYIFRMRGNPFFPDFRQRIHGFFKVHRNISSIFSYIDEINCLFPIMNFKKTNAKDKYSLPIKLRGSGFVLDLESRSPAYHHNETDSLHIPDARQPILP